MLGAKVLITIYDDRWSDIKKSIIGLTEVDMTNNGGIFYISPDFLMNLKEFGKNIKIGIQTKGYEEMHNGNNLLMCIGFIGKLTLSSNTKFKLKVDDVVEIMGNKGISLIKPIKIDPEKSDLNFLTFIRRPFFRQNCLFTIFFNLLFNYYIN